MPELPEVETVLRGIKPHLIHQVVESVTLRHLQLRWPVPKNLKKILQGDVIQDIQRRAKYLLFRFEHGTLILHLGMSGSLRILTHSEKANKHDHFDLVCQNGIILRLTDPRRFGAILWCEDDPYQHPLLKNIGPEPLSADFSGKYLAIRAQTRKVPIKNLIMNQTIVAGVGNIYAAEALFVAGIHPLTPAKQLVLHQFQALVQAIKLILRQAIKQGGTTLKDFVNSSGKPGYFAHQLKVYGRVGHPCVNCQIPLKSTILAQRSTVFCPNCQKQGVL